MLVEAAGNSVWEFVMRIRRLALPVAALAACAFFAGAPARADILIKIDKATQTMTVEADGKELYHWPVSTGRERYDTPDGAYTPVSMETMHYSRQWDWAPMPHSIFFTGEGHAIHGTYEESHLGRPVSHGCVRLSRKNAATLYDMVRKEGKAHTTVVLTGTLPHDTRALVAHRARPSNDKYAKRNDVSDDATPAPQAHRPRSARNTDDERRSERRYVYDSGPRYYGRGVYIYDSAPRRYGSWHDYDYGPRRYYYRRW
jgi:L,D-transpeptidase catalytic domain